MAKTRVSSVVPGQVGDIQRAAIEAEAEAQTTAAPAPSLDSLLDPTPVAPSAPETASMVEEAVLAGLEAEGQRAGELETERKRQEIAPIGDRIRDKETVHRWGRKQPDMPTTDGGLFQRAIDLSQSVASGAVQPRFRAGGESSAAYAAGNVMQAAELANSPLAAAVQKAGAVVDVGTSSTIDPDYAMVGSVITENTIAMLAHGKTDQEIDFVAEALGETPIPKSVATADNKERPKVAKAQANEKLGQDIHAEYMRRKNAQQGKNPDEFEKLSPEEAVLIGDAFKEMYAMQNPHMLKRFVDPKTQQAYYQLTGDGAKELARSDAMRKRIFAGQVRPSKAIPEGGKLAGDTGRQVKPWLGKVGTTEGAQILKASARNLSTIPNVVDKQRGKILLSTFIPVLAGTQMDPTLAEAFAEINNVGPTKVRKFAAAKKAQDRRRAAAEAEGKRFEETEYDPDANLEALIDKIAQEVRAVAMERDGANYLTYSTAAFNGRQQPQQTFFDPTTSKAVRFVTRNAVPTKIEKGSRTFRNLQQMYAMMLVKGADAALPPERVRMLEAATPQLRAWGKRLSELLDQTMTDQQYEELSQAIAEGKPLDQLPAVQPLALDPQQDAELIAAIKKKGEDGPHFIDGLIDFFNFDRHMRADRPYYSYFNAYMDGKTNGIASNGIQMGHAPTAMATGVMRANKTQLLDDGDIRDQLKNNLIDLIEEGWDGEVDPDWSANLNNAARAVFSWRELNKATTMTFGYGKEVSSFKANIDETIGELVEIANSGDIKLIEEHGLSTFADDIAVLDEAMGRSTLAETLLTKYAVGLEQALSDDAIQSRTIMRSAATMFAAMDDLFTIVSPTGFDLHLGREVSEGSATADEFQYTIGQGEGDAARVKATKYKTRATSAASRMREDVAVPGEYAYGGSLPGPVQSIDAATVAMTVTGESWRKLRSRSGGNPYIHTIYDAFKVDAAGYDTVLEEVNKNWLDASMEWSYLEKTKDSWLAAKKRFIDEYRSTGPDQVLTDQQAEFLNFYMDPSESPSGKFPSKLMRKLYNILQRPAGLDDEAWSSLILSKVGTINKAMKQAGYEHGKPVTTGMRYAFIKALDGELDLTNRLSQMITKTNNNKKDLKQQIKSAGVPVYQYYAH